MLHSHSSLPQDPCQRVQQPLGIAFLHMSHLPICTPLFALVLRCLFGHIRSGHPAMLMFCSLMAPYDAVQHRCLRLRHGKQVYSGHVQSWRVGGQPRAKQQER